MIARYLTCSLAALACAVAPPAFAQVELSEADMALVARAAMPSALTSIQTRCDPVLDSDAYMFARGEALQRRLAPVAQDAWPQAVRLFARLAARGNPAMGEVLAGMPPESLRPFMAELVAGMVNQQVPTEQCARIDRVLELLDPLPAENLAQLAAFAFAEARAEQQARSASGAAR